MADDLKPLATCAIDRKASELNELSLSIWNKPELCFEEHHAHEVITSFLEKEGFKVQRKTPLDTAFIARYGDGSGLKVGVCCEYDALPGIGHACGHNLIAEAGVAAAIGIKEALMRAPDLKAEVIVFGTPAEEGGGGKVKMIEKGCFDQVDICMMSHPGPLEIPVPVCLGVNQLNLIFHGRPSHAAAAPWEGINALDAAVACYNAISMLRQQTKPTSRVHAIFTDGGQKPNIIPERAVLNVLVRGITDADFRDLEDKVKNCAKGAALSTGCTLTIEDDVAPYYKSVKTNQVLIDLYINNVKSLGVKFEDEKRPGGSTDMGNVSQIIPSIHPLYKIKTEAVNHTHEFTAATYDIVNQLPTLNSAKGMAMTAIDVIFSPSLMKDVRKEFEQS